MRAFSAAPKQKFALDALHFPTPPLRTGHKGAYSGEDSFRRCAFAYLIIPPVLPDARTLALVRPILPPTPIGSFVGKCAGQRRRRRSLFDPFPIPFLTASTPSAKDAALIGILRRSHVRGRNGPGREGRPELQAVFPSVPSAAPLQIRFFSPFPDAKVVQKVIWRFPVKRERLIESLAPSLMSVCVSRVCVSAPAPVRASERAGQEMKRCPAEIGRPGRELKVMSFFWREGFHGGREAFSRLRSTMQMLLEPAEGRRGRKCGERNTTRWQTSQKRERASFGTRRKGERRRF